MKKLTPVLACLLWLASSVPLHAEDGVLYDWGKKEAPVEDQVVTIFDPADAYSVCITSSPYMDSVEIMGVMLSSAMLQDNFVFLSSSDSLLTWNGHRPQSSSGNRMMDEFNDKED